MTPGPVTITLAAPTTDQWAGLDIPAMVAQLKATGVVAPADKVQALEQIVARAESDGHDVNFVVLSETYTPFTVYRDIATTLQAQVGGTVVVIGSGGIGTSSSEFSRVQLEDASNAVTTGSSAESAASQIYDKAIAPNADWTLVTIGLVLVVVLGAVIARVTQLRRRAAGLEDSGSSAPAVTSVGATDLDADAASELVDDAPESAQR